MKQYSFTKVDLLIDGVAVEGFADSASIITADRSVNAHNKVVDAKGDVNIATSGDLTGFISFNLLHTSEWNDIMNALVLVTQTVGTDSSSNTFVPIQALIKDKMGTTLITGVDGWIPKTAAQGRGNSVGTVPWRVEFSKLIFGPLAAYENVGVA